MDDYALVLNAGSSSLKFCVFQRADERDWQIAARGQIEGIGTSPRLSAKDAEGGVLANDNLDASVRDGHAALDALASLAPLEMATAHACSVSATASFTAARATASQS